MSEFDWKSSCFFSVDIKKAICTVDLPVNVSRLVDLRLNCTVKYAKLLSKEQSQRVNFKSVLADQESLLINANDERVEQFKLRRTAHQLPAGEDGSSYLKSDVFISKSSFFSFYYSSLHSFHLVLLLTLIHRIKKYFLLSFLQWMSGNNSLLRRMSVFLHRNGIFSTDEFHSNRISREKKRLNSMTVRVGDVQIQFRIHSYCERISQLVCAAASRCRDTSDRTAVHSID